VDICADCVARGDSWPDLRMCLIWGYLGWGDTSKNKHVRKHFEETGHPLVRATAPGDNWLWCYIDNALIAREW